MLASVVCLRESRANVGGMFSWLVWGGVLAWVVQHAIIVIIAITEVLSEEKKWMFTFETKMRQCPK